jgi:tetratricopeptide (TPR) repeat protein
VGAYTCEAFSSGIPDEIFYHGGKHNKPLLGQGNNIVFESSGYAFSIPQWWSRQKKLDSQGYSMFFKKEYDEAEKLFLKALNEKEQNPIDKHFVYNHLIHLYYKLRDKRKDALNKCIYYCKEDIKSLPEFLELYKKENPNNILLPQCPSVIQLAIIYEKLGELKNAIDICKSALALGLKDGTKEGFEAPLKKLEKKI